MLLIFLLNVFVGLYLAKNNYVFPTESMDGSWHAKLIVRRYAAVFECDRDKLNYVIGDWAKLRNSLLTFHTTGKNI